MAKTMRALQIEQAEWAQRNFGDRPATDPALGLIEEVGELAHAILKRSQGIRGTAEEHTAAIIDAIGDCAIYLCDYATRRGIVLPDVAWPEWPWNPVMVEIVGDLAVFAGQLMQFIDRTELSDVAAFARRLSGAAKNEGRSLQECVDETWKKVRLRDWQANPTDGAAEAKGEPTQAINIVFQGEGPERQFVDIEDDNGRSIRVGEWKDCEYGVQVLRIERIGRPADDVCVSCAHLRCARGLRPADVDRVLACVSHESRPFGEPVEAGCARCGQTEDRGGEYPCPGCGLPTVHDEPLPAVQAEPVVESCPDCAWLAPLGETCVRCGDADRHAEHCSRRNDTTRPHCGGYMDEGPPDPVCAECNRFDAAYREATQRRAYGCRRCNGTGRVEIGCSLCGDSTYDHACNDHSQVCAECNGSGRSGLQGQQP